MIYTRMQSARQAAALLLSDNGGVLVLTSFDWFLFESGA